MIHVAIVVLSSFPNIAEIGNKSVEYKRHNNNRMKKHHFVNVHLSALTPV